MMVTVARGEVTGNDFQRARGRRGGDEREDQGEQPQHGCNQGPRGRWCKGEDALWGAVGIDQGISRCHVPCMRTTLALDDALLAEAQALTGVQEKSAWCGRR